MSNHEFPNYCELTFRTEGGHLPSVLKAHWPGGVSGVTIGPGYDMGHRSAASIVTDLRAAGLPQASIDKLSRSAGMTGTRARDWVNAHADEVVSLTRPQSMALFTHVYPVYVGRTRDIIRSWGGNWDAYPQKMKEVLVDLTFRGDLSDRHKLRLLPSITAADYRAFRAVIHDHTYWVKNTNLKNSVRDGSINQRITARSEWLPEDAGTETPSDWKFPFPSLEGNEIQDAGIYTGSPSLPRAAMERAQDGFYPIGASGIWHGGIHFDAGTGTVLNQWEGIRCIKDGEVVAYQVNKKYPEITFHPSENKAAYSTGFTLVRHRLERPAAATAANKPNDPKAGKTVATGTASKEEAKPATLVFYSLYMHLLDFEGYKESPRMPRPSYWGPPKEYKVGTKAKDQQESPPTPEPEAIPEPALEDLEFDGLDTEECGC